MAKDAIISGDNNPLDRPRDITHYTRWTDLVGTIGKCGVVVNNEYLVQQTEDEEEDCFKVVIENETNGETIS